MKENIKIHVSELFKRNEINNEILEKELIKALEEKYDDYFLKTDNEVTSFNKTISLIGDINEIKAQNKIILKEEKTAITIEQRKKVKKFSKINLIISIIVYALVSFIFGNWITSWLIFGLSFIVDAIYKLYCYRQNYHKVIRYITTAIYSLFAVIIILIVSISAVFVDYDYSFELKEENIKKEIIVNDEYQSLKISLLNSDVIIESYEGSEVKVTQYSKHDLPEKYYFKTSSYDSSLNIKENKAPLFFMSNYYHSIYKILIPNNSIISDIDIYGISSDIKIIGNINISNLSIESTSGNIHILGSVVIEKEANLKVLKGYLNVANILSKDLLNISSTSGKITANNIVANKMNISSLAGDIEVKNIGSTSLIINSTAGAITGENIAGLININDKNGDVQLANIELTGQSKIVTENGNISLLFNDYKIYNLSVKSENGKVENKYLDNIEGYIFEILSTNGNISILIDK